MLHPCIKESSNCEDDIKTDELIVPSCSDSSDDTKKIEKLSCEEDSTPYSPDNAYKPQRLQQNHLIFTKSES